MQSQKEKVQKISEDIEKLCAETPSLTDDLNVTNIKTFLSHWEETNKKITLFDSRLKDKSFDISSETVLKLTRSAPNDDISEDDEEEDDEQVPIELTNAIKGLSLCLDKTKFSIESDFMKTINNSNALEKELKKFEELIKTVNSEEANLKHINNCSKEIIDSFDNSK